MFEAATTGEGRRRWDDVLTGAGVRWTLLRWVRPAVRRDLGMQVLARQEPAGTRRAESGQLWLDAVRERVESSPAFQQARSRRRALRIAEVYAARADRDARPLTWIPQEEIAAAVGLSSDRQIRRYLEWFKSVGLLFEVVAGTRVTAMSRPSDETDAEAAARHDRATALDADALATRQARDAAYRAAQDAKRAGARAEIEAIRGGASAAAAAEAGRAARDACPVPDIAAAEHAHRVAVSAASEHALLNLAAVYELRRPETEAEAIEAAAAREAVRSGDAARSKNVRPPSLSRKIRGSGCVRGVDKSGGAARRSDMKGASSARKRSDLDAAGLSGPSEGDRPSRRASRAVRTAEALLSGSLDRRVSRGVSVRWLAARIAGSGLLDRGWSVGDFADQIHGVPDYPKLPRAVHNPRAWIHTRLLGAGPLLPPRPRIGPRIDDAHAEARKRRAEVDGCSLCDDNGITEGAGGVQRCRHDPQVSGCSLCDAAGWLSIADAEVDAVRCNHDHETGGW